MLLALLHGLTCPLLEPSRGAVCKCRACNACHNGSAALPQWASGAYARCRRFGDCLDWQGQQAQEAAEREAQRELARAVLHAELKEQHSRERAEYWATHRSVGGGALCNTSADCSHHGMCRPPARVARPNITWAVTGGAARSGGSSAVSGSRGGGGGGGGTSSGGQPHPAAQQQAELRLDASPRCFCDDGFAGARCSYAAFSKLRSGGAACNATLPCGGEGSSCVRSRCVCGRGWLGARCSFASFSVLAGISGGAYCNTSSECGGAHTGASCDRHVISGVAVGRCRCGPGRVGARCAYAAFGDLEGGGGSCNFSSQCGGTDDDGAAPPTRSSSSSGDAAASRHEQKALSVPASGRIAVELGEGAVRPSPPSAPPGALLISRASSTAGGASSASGLGLANGSGSNVVTAPQNVSKCVQQRCVCAVGRLGARCAYTSDQLLLAARARARREQQRVQSLHLCLSAWRGGESGGKQGQEEQALADGTPLTFALCRNRQNAHQRWKHQPEQRGSAMRIRSEGAPGLCVTVPPLYEG